MLSIPFSLPAFHAQGPSYFPFPLPAAAPQMAEAALGLTTLPTLPGAPPQVPTLSRGGTEDQVMGWEERPPAEEAEARVGMHELWVEETLIAVGVSASHPTSLP